MPKVINNKFLSELEKLSKDELDKIRLSIEEKFKEQLKRIPPNADELLHDAIEHTLMGIRNNWNKDPIEKYLTNVVESMVSHLYESVKKEVNNYFRSELEKLSDDERDEIYEKNKNKFGAQLAKIPNAPNADELLHNAIVGSLMGIRNNWNKKPIEKYLIYDVVRSMVSHLWNGYKESLSDIYGYTIELSDMGQGRHHWFKKTADAVVNKMPTKEESDLREQILTCVEGDHEVEIIVRYQLDHLDEYQNDHPKAQIIPVRVLAKELCMDVSIIYNANKRLIRKCEKLREKIQI
jgi:hypothetical protein